MVSESDTRLCVNKEAVPQRPDYVSTRRLFPKGSRHETVSYSKDTGPIRGMDCDVSYLVGFPTVCHSKDTRPRRGMDCDVPHWLGGETFP